MVLDRGLEVELAPFYDQAVDARRRDQSEVDLADDVFKLIADDLGVADTFHPTQVGSFFGEPGKTVPDPYFGGIGPRSRRLRLLRALHQWMPANAKNILERNYLYLAEKAGAQVHPMTTVVDVRESPAGGYQVETVHTGRWVRKQRQTWRADQVVFFLAAALGTQNLLHRLRANGSSPRISARLGELARTNSEVNLIATSRTRTDLAQGVAGTSSIHPDNTHIEAFRLGRGSNWDTY